MSLTLGRTARQTTSLVIALAIAFATASGQTPARDAAREQPAGTASVSGVVFTGDAPGQPLRRVTVTLMSAALRAPLSTVTSDDGRFELTGVAAGQYIVRASRPGYVDTVLGASPGGVLGSPVAVVDGERLAGISIHMPRGGVITGTVRFANGRPAREVDVMVSPIRVVDGRRRMRLSSGFGVVRTDDRGMYRQFGLPPGDFVVQVLAGLTPMPGGASVRWTTPAEVAWAERLAGATGATTTLAARAEPSPGRVLALAPVYYPGTTSLELAQAVTLQPGEERAGIDLGMTYVPTARVAGTVRGLDGSPQAGVTVRLTPHGEVQSAADVMSAVVGRGMTTSDDTGRFVIDEVPPGDYALTARAARPGASETGGDAATPNLMSMFQQAFGRAGAGTLHANAPVIVTGADIEGVGLRLAEGVTVSGRVVFEGTTDPPSPSTIQVMLAGVSTSTSAMEQAMAMVMAVGESGQVSSDLTFTIHGVPPARYRATVTMPGMMFGTPMPAATTWALKSIRSADGIDVADVPFEVEAGREIDGLVVTLTDRPSVLSGRVIDAAGRPVSAFPILVFSTDSAHWMAGSRRVQQIRPANDGTYRITGLPAGQYYVGAVTTLELDDLYDPSFLQQIVPIAFTITIADGEAKEQNLKVGG